MSAIALFVKTPGYSTVKSRLARDRGQAFAEDFHWRSARAVAEVAQTAAIGSVYWAVAEPAAMADSVWHSLPCLAQGAGGLGERMARVHRMLVERHGAGILLGADAPQISARDLQTAARWLAGPPARLALGEARDGGFWTFGANRPIAEMRWRQVDYSLPDTAQCFRRALEGLGEWLDLPKLTDLDEAEALDALIDELGNAETPTESQAELLAWLRVSLPG